MDHHELAQVIAQFLADRAQRLVLAESCTAGQIAATLGKVPGISDHFCGSAVVYRERTKEQWLGVEAEQLRLHTAVSREVTQSLARNVLRHTDEATLSLAITGHLGPHAPDGQDGELHLVICARQAGTVVEKTAVTHRLQPADRSERQAEAVRLALELLRDQLQG